MEKLSASYGVLDKSKSRKALRVHIPTQVRMQTLSNHMCRQAVESVVILHNSELK